MNQQEVNNLIEEHYEHYVSTIRDKTNLGDDDARDFLHQLYINYVDPLFTDGCKYGGPYDRSSQGQIRLWDQYIHLSCKKWRTRNRVRIKREDLHSQGTGSDQVPG